MLTWDRYDIDKEIETTIIIKYWYAGKYHPATFESEGEQPELLYDFFGIDEDQVTEEEHKLIQDAIYWKKDRITSNVKREGECQPT